jgi:hypothetical protein
VCTFLVPYYPRWTSFTQNYLLSMR